MDGKYPTIDLILLNKQIRYIVLKYDLISPLLGPSLVP